MRFMDCATEDVAGRCLKCDYDLRGITSRNCPECGRAFDPADDRTWRVAKANSRLARWALRKPGIRLIAITVVSLLLIVWYGRFPGSVRAELRWYSVLCFCLPLIWANRLACRWWLRRRGHLLDEDTTGRGLAALTFALILVVQSECISSAALYISRPGLERLTEELPPYQVPLPKPRWAGVYLIQGGRLPGGILWSAELDCSFEREDHSFQQPSMWKSVPGQWHMFYEEL